MILLIRSDSSWSWLSQHLYSSSDTNGNRSCSFSISFQLHYSVFLFFQVLASEIPKISLISARVELPRDSVPSVTECFFVLGFTIFSSMVSLGLKQVDLNRFFPLSDGHGQWLASTAKFTKGQPDHCLPVRFQTHQPWGNQKASLSPLVEPWSYLVFPWLRLNHMVQDVIASAVLVQFSNISRKSRRCRRLPPVPVGLGDYLVAAGSW